MLSSRGLGVWVIPHQTHHGLDVRNERLVSAENLRSRIVTEGEPGPVFLNQLLPSARIEHLLKVPTAAEHKLVLHQLLLE